MKVIHIKDILNNVKTYNLIRAFKYNNKEYIIYTLNEEIKENNKLYIKNYVIEKNKEDIWITPDYFEWKSIQNIIKEIAKQSSLGFVNVVKDINIPDKETIMVVGNRSFMVIPYYHHLLSTNNNYISLAIEETDLFKPEVLNRNLVHQFEIGTLDMPNINYVDEYYYLKKESDELKQKIKRIKEIINNIDIKD